MIRIRFERGRQTTLKIIGMHCATCTLAVQKALLSVPGVLHAEASLAGDEAKVVADPTRLRYGDLLRAVRKAGYDIYREEAHIVLKAVRPEEVSRIAELLSGWGVFDVRPNPAAGVVTVEYNPLEVTPGELARKLEEAGYEVAEVKTGEVDIDVDRRVVELDRADLRRRLAVAAGPTAALVALMVASMAGLHAAVYWLQWALATPVQFYSGWRFIKGAYRAFRNKTANMDTLVTLGTLSTYFYSVYSLLTGGLVYFEASAAVITLVLLGRYIEAGMRIKTGEAVRRLLTLQPEKARVLENGAEVEVPAAQVKPGQLVAVKQGERAPVDGVVEEGFGYVDESAFTGEPMPVEKKKGDLILAGSILVRGYLVVRATRSGRHTLLAQMVKLVRQAQGARLPVQQLVDKISGVFTWAVIAVASAVFVLWYLTTGDINRALIFTASVLVVACPCALGLATPLSVVVGVGRAAEKGVLIKRPEALQKLREARYVAFDKTGTLTLGRPRVVAVWGGDEVLNLAASLEQKSEHPLAAAVVEYARERNLKLSEPEFFDSIPGAGVYGRINGVAVAVGNEKILRGMGAELPPEVAKWAEEMREQGYTVVYVATEGKTLGAIAVGDQIREGAWEAVHWLKTRGVEPVIVTGDHEKSARAVAKKLGISVVYSGVDPEEKAKIVEALKSRGLVVFVGDGVNDAAALATADVGIAVGTGTDVAKEAGDTILLRGDITKVVEVFKISEKIMRNVKFNLFWAFVYNIALIPLAAGVFYPVTLRPELAGLAMAFSSISVTLNALRLRGA
ncbi:heavy metal translocating P-type ATPase [Pyrobaculum islandicum DSM 4184]|uniref:Heavy metal translocating P-type ATPase n=1 Tax=Pyrobaculum islandicum (strain DSM 4184 / JCM 9189 / GEO3) TaxID=384616 RepID=A1RUG7_PYRIL|nr:heavy metal translocating P-type ATPase [Pyrobaculum islandicum]ABL88599.1 heavy metal translocating P-type ATPase [Pyrobaculum islandicum DSM 4184]